MSDNDKNQPTSINVPCRPVLPPADRHYITRITRHTAPDDQTTLITPQVDVGADLTAIRGGFAKREGNIYTVNKRRWFHKPNGRMYPIDGEGFIGPVSRGTMHAPKALARYNGVNDLSAYEMRRSPGISEDDRIFALAIWEIRATR